jgi:hypothetical protein
MKASTHLASVSRASIENIDGQRAYLSLVALKGED